jgi:hypothetical protein
MRTELAEHQIESGIGYGRKQLHTAPDAITGLTIPGEGTMSQIDGMR